MIAADAPRCYDIDAANDSRCRWRHNNRDAVLMRHYMATETMTACAVMARR